MSFGFILCLIYLMLCKDLFAQVVTKSFKRVSSPNVNVTSLGPTFTVQSLLTCATRISQGSSNYFFYQHTTKSCYAGIDANVSQIPNGAQVYKFDNFVLTAPTTTQPTTTSPTTTSPTTTSPTTTPPTTTSPTTKPPTTTSPNMLVFDMTLVDFVTANSTCTSINAYLIKFDNLTIFNTLKTGYKYWVGCYDYVGNNIFHWTCDGSQVPNQLFIDFLDPINYDYTSDSCCLYCDSHKTLHIYPCTDLYYFICVKY